MLFDMPGVTLRQTGEIREKSPPRPARAPVKNQVPPLRLRAGTRTSIRTRIGA